jgi:hypothetical protein
VLVAGFATRSGDPIDTNEEMVRLLRAQLRSKSSMHVIEADLMSPMPESIDDVQYWRRLGEEHREPLIVSGTVSFRVATEFRPVGPVETAYQAANPHRTPVAPAFEEHSHFSLESRFVFVDGATGVALCSRNFREDAVFRGDEDVPPLAAFFNLMDRLVPGFLLVVADQSIAQPRVLLK